MDVQSVEIHVRKMHETEGAGYAWEASAVLADGGGATQSCSWLGEAPWAADAVEEAISAVRSWHWRTLHPNVPA